jgi:hypothetical protein
MYKNAHHCIKGMKVLEIQHTANSQSYRHAPERTKRLTEPAIHYYEFMSSYTNALAQDKPRDLLPV